ncbi:hypothetical protein [Burkholderia vietnamiensis]|uniref:hypothetical protein n=1 Tax=Burkholderia vietnamiensis TaxID=60552 RepID=UPI0015940751|nr:hypothetical protein [Burkholderia vietnamiensis]MCA8198509.1 hypothetical protein [Burkholderia vietnamiensis]
MTSKQENQLRKARQRISKVFDIASAHTGAVAGEIARLAADALLDLDVVLGGRPASDGSPEKVAVAGDTAPAPEVQIRESPIRLKS